MIKSNEISIVIEVLFLHQGMRYIKNVYDKTKQNSRPRTGENQP